MPEISRLDWPIRSDPAGRHPGHDRRQALPGRGRRVLGRRGGQLPVEGNGPRVGAARIIDISDETAPSVVSDIRLEVNQPEYRAQVGGDPGASEPGPGLRRATTAASRAGGPGHRRVLVHRFGPARVRHPRPLPPEGGRLLRGAAGGEPRREERSNFAMSKPVFDAARRHVWYSDGNSGLYAVRLTNGAWPAAPRRAACAGAASCWPVARAANRAR